MHIRVLTIKPLGKFSLGSPKRRPEKKIKMDLRSVGSEDRKITEEAWIVCDCGLWFSFATMMSVVRSKNLQF